MAETHRGLERESPRRRLVHRPRPETLDELVHGALERGGTEAGDDDGEVRTRVESARKTRDGGGTRETRVAEGGGGWKTESAGERRDVNNVGTAARARTLGANSMTMHSLFGSAMKDS